MGAMKKKDNREWTRMDANLENGQVLFIGNLGIGEEVTANGAMKKKDNREWTRPEGEVTANGGDEEEGQPRMDANGR
jgi:hypothetical protein